MPQDKNHYTLRLTGSNDADRIALMQRTGDSANSVLNEALRVGFAALMPRWSAPCVHRVATASLKLLTYNGNARKFRSTLLAPPSRKVNDAKKPLHQ